MRGNRGQSTVEYVATVLIVTAALLAMRIYMKRGYSGYLRGASDSMGSQYDPKNTTSNLVLETSGTTKTTANLLKDYDFGKDLDGDGKPDTADVMVTKSEIVSPEEAKTRGWEEVGAMGNRLWN